MNQEQQLITIAKEYDQTRPAFPCPPGLQSNGFYSNGNGITIREYAAIKLRVPDSGVPWLDEMIVKAKRDYFAAAIMQGLMASQWQVDDPYPIYAYKIADAMIKAREVKP